MHTADAATTPETRNDSPSRSSLKYTTPCPILLLPKELRDLIYHFLILSIFHSPGTIIKPKICPISGKPSPSPPALARTCHQFRQEVIPAFYGERVWYMEGHWNPEPEKDCWRLVHDSLWYLRSIQFDLITAPSKIRSSARVIQPIVTVRVDLTKERTLNVVYWTDPLRDSIGGICDCDFAKFARAGEQRMTGVEVEPPVIRYWRNWDVWTHQDRPLTSSLWLNEDYRTTCAACGKIISPMWLRYGRIIMKAEP
jgi:hypothetical protein